MTIRELLSELADEKWIDVLTGERSHPLVTGDALPRMPKEAVQLTTVGRSGRRVMTDANAFRVSLKLWMAQFSSPVGPRTRVLDFGCGWARILRLFLKDVDAEYLLGVDVQEWLLDVARETAPSCRVQLIRSSPPTALAEESFDLIYAYSVFSHLPEKVANNWIREFTRLLAPMGLLVLTTRPRAHLENLGKPTSDKTAHTAHYAEIIRDAKSALLDYDGGGFVFYPAGGHQLSPEEFGEAAIPKSYVEKNWTKGLEFMGFFESYSETYLQPAIILRKSP